MLFCRGQVCFILCEMDVSSLEYLMKDCFSRNQSKV